MCATSGASGVSIFQRNRKPFLTACPVCQRCPQNLFQRRRPTLFSERHPRGRICSVHGPCCHKISAFLKTVQNTSRKFRATWCIWVCSHPSRIAFSVRCLSSLLPFGFLCVLCFASLGLFPPASLCVFSADSVGCVLTQRFPAFQCNTTLGLLRLVSLGIFLAHSVGFVLTRDFVRCSVKRLRVWSHPFSLSQRPPDHH